MVKHLIPRPQRDLGAILPTDLKGELCETMASPSTQSQAAQFGWANPPEDYARGWEKNHPKSRGK